MSETSTPSPESLTGPFGQIVVSHWQLGQGYEIPVDGQSTVTITNGSDHPVHVSYDGVERTLPPRGTLTHPVTAFGGQRVRLSGDPRARGRYVLYDKAFPWAAGHGPFPFSGALDLAVVSSPRSPGAVQVTAGGLQLGAVEPGHIGLFHLDDAQARTLDVAGPEGAEGSLCRLGVP
ncbi:MAG: hypothetical protein AAGF23_03350 [Acidobacteriota bacterium]